MERKFCWQEGDDTPEDDVNLLCLDFGEPRRALTIIEISPNLIWPIPDERNLDHEAFYAGMYCG